MRWGCTPRSLRGRSQQRFFDFDSTRPRTASRCRTPRRRFQQARRDRRLQHAVEHGEFAHPRADAGRLRHHRPQESRRQAFDRRRHSQPAQPDHRRLARLFRPRPDRRPECAHLGPRRLGLRREHDERHHPDREERRLAVRRGDPRRRSRVQGRCRLAHRHRHEGRHDHRRRRYRRLHRLHDAARPHGDLRQCRQESRRLHV